jgi:hypothetical protein
VGVDGLWTADFRTQSGAGTGVVVLTSGRIMGGDAHYYYSGSYSEEGNRFQASLVVKHYAGALTNVFGQLREVHLTLVGSASSEYILAQGQVPSLSFSQLSVKLRRVEKL